MGCSIYSTEQTEHQRGKTIYSKHISRLKATAWMLTQCRILFHKEVIFRKASHVQNYVVGQPSDFITHSSKLGPHNFSYHFSIKLFQYIEKRNLLNRKTTKHLVKDRFDVENKQEPCPVLSPDVNHTRCTQTVSNKGPEVYCRIPIWPWIEGNVSYGSPAWQLWRLYYATQTTTHEHQGLIWRLFTDWSLVLLTQPHHILHKTRATIQDSGIREVTWGIMFFSITSLKSGGGGKSSPSMRKGIWLTSLSKVLVSTFSSSSASTSPSSRFPASLLFWVSFVTFSSPWTSNLY